MKHGYNKRAAALQSVKCDPARIPTLERTGGGFPPAGLWKPRFDPGGGVLSRYRQTRGASKHCLRDVLALEAVGCELVIGKPRERLETMRERTGVLDTLEEGAEAVAN